MCARWVVRRVIWCGVPGRSVVRCIGSGMLLKSGRRSARDVLRDWFFIHEGSSRSVVL